MSKINHKHLIKSARVFAEEMVVILDERGRQHGNIDIPKYHLHGISVKADRAVSGRIDRDTAIDGACYHFLHWYTANRRRK